MGMDPVTMSAIVAGGSQLAGTLLKDDPKGPAQTPTMANPYFEPMMARMFGILDKYLTENGIAAFIPPERLPYELRSPEGRAQVREDVSRGQQNGQQIGIAPPPALYQPIEGSSTAATPALHRPPRSPNGSGDIQGLRDDIRGVKRPEQNGERSLQLGDVGQTPSYASFDPYTNASLAASLGARRLGVKQDAPQFQTTREFAERDEATKQEELNRIYQYIYGQRSMGV